RKPHVLSAASHGAAFGPPRTAAVALRCVALLVARWSTSPVRGPFAGSSPWRLAMASSQIRPLVDGRPIRERRESGPAGRLSRRRLLGSAAAGAGLAALASGSRSWSAARQGATPTAIVSGAAFVEPRELRSTDGRLDVALEA